MLDDKELSHDAALWQGMIDLGWTGVSIPEQYGGVGQGYLELCVIAEELGRSQMSLARLHCLVTTCSIRCNAGCAPY